MRKVDVVEKNEGGWEDKRISEIVATNINASQPPHCRSTGMQTACAKICIKDVELHRYWTLKTDTKN